MKLFQFFTKKAAFKTQGSGMFLISLYVFTNMQISRNMYLPITVYLSLIDQKETVMSVKI